MSIGHTFTASYHLVCNNCKATRNEPFCQVCEPTSGEDVYTPRHDGFAAYEAELDRAAEQKARERRRAEVEGDLVDIFDNA